MPHSKQIEEKIEEVVGRWKQIEKKKMFGGLCYLLHGNMCFGIYKDYLIIRTDIDLAEKKLKEKNVKPFDITGKPMKGWLMVEENGLKGQVELKNWLDMGKKFALALPKK